jgi:hypothetical protein
LLETLRQEDVNEITSIIMVSVTAMKAKIGRPNWGSIDRRCDPLESKHRGLIALLEIKINGANPAQRAC